MPSADGPNGAGHRGAEPDRDGGELFRKIGERQRYSGFFALSTATFVGPDGFTFEREIVRHPGAVCAVALEADRRHVVMVRQYRAAVGRSLLELPAGKRDRPDEDPRDCIVRELAEEIGRVPGELTELARFFNSPGFSDEETICYLAEDLAVTEREAHGIEEEHLIVEQVALVEIEDLMSAGELVDAKSIIGLVAARTVLRGARAHSSQPTIFGE